MADKPFPAYEGDDPYFFVSYAHEDAALVYPEMAWLEPSGFNLWYDDGIHVGTVWRQALADALSKSSGLIFFATAKSVESSNCLKELNFVLDEEKPVFVVQIDDTPLPSLLRLSLSDRQALVKSKYDPHTYQSRLIGALSTVVPPVVRKASGTAPKSSMSKIKTDPPSIAILPLTCLGGDKELGYLAQGITGDLIAKLSQRIWHIVAGQAEDVALEPREVGEKRGVRYLVSGTLQKGGDRIRVTARVTIAATGQEIWAKRYERSGEDFLDIQDRLSNSIEVDLFDPIMTAEEQRLRHVPDEELDAWGLCARSRGLPVVDRASRDRVRGLLELAIRRDPNFAFAHSVYAMVLSTLIYNQFTRNIEEDRKTVVDHANTALRLAPNNLLVLEQVSFAHRICGDLDHALHLAQRAADASGRPGNTLASALLLRGRFEEALEIGRDSNESATAGTMVMAALAAGRKDEALEWARRGTTEYPQNFLYWVYLAAVQGAQGRIDQAKESVLRARDIVPTFTLELFEKGMRIAWRGKDEVIDPVMDGLRKLELD